MVVKGDIRKLPFVHFVRNIYLVFLPRLDEDRDSTIEDFLDPKALSKKLENKTFTPKKGKLQGTKHFGKIPLAVKV